MKKILDRKLVKCTLVVVFCAFVTTMFHGFVSMFFPVFIPVETSFLATKIGFPLTSFIYFILAYSCIAFIFCKYQTILNGSKIKKGLIFGVSFGLIWLWGVIETSVLFGSSLVYEFCTGFADFSGILVLALMLRRFCFSNNVPNNEKSNENKFKILLAIVFAVIFCIGRYAIYFSDLIVSTYQERPYATFIWTLVMGVLIAIIYFMLEDLSKTKSPIKKSFEFGIIIFGLNWLVFYEFIPFFLKVSVVEMFVRAILDIIVVILCCYVIDNLEKRITKNSEKRN